MTVYSPFGRISHPDYQNVFEKGLFPGNLNDPQFRFELKDMPRWLGSHINPGKHIFEITVFFDNIPPIKKQFELLWSGNWSGDYTQMLKEIVIQETKTFI